MKKEEEEKKQFGRLGAFWFGTFRPTRGLDDHENTQRCMVRCYKHISLPCLRFGEIFLCPCYLYIRVYRLYDNYKFS